MKVKNLPLLPDNDSRLCHFWLRERAVRKLPIAKACNEIECPRCGSKNGYSILLDPAKGSERMWFCTTDRCIELDKKHKVFDPIPGFGKTKEENAQLLEPVQKQKNWSKF